MPQLRGKLLQLDEPLEPLLDRAFQILPDEGAIHVLLVHLDDRIGLRVSLSEKRLVHSP